MARTVSYAISEAGYRHIDCAWGYMNEKGVGEGIKKSGIKREELFVSIGCIDPIFANGFHEI